MDMGPVAAAVLAILLLVMHRDAVDAIGHLEWVDAAKWFVAGLRTVATAERNATMINAADANALSVAFWLSSANSGVTKKEQGHYLMLRNLRR